MSKRPFGAVLYWHQLFKLVTLRAKTKPALGFQAGFVVSGAYWALNIPAFTGTENVVSLDRQTYALNTNPVSLAVNPITFNKTKPFTHSTSFC
jgi:hypothetical protein